MSISHQQIKRIPHRIPREQVERDEESLRSIEISQMRILARKRPKEYLKVAKEIHLDIEAELTA